MQKNLALLAVLIIFLGGCSNAEVTPIQNESGIKDTLASEPDSGEGTQESAVELNGWKVVDGMKYLPDFGEEEYYYCMGLTGREERGKNIVAPGIEIGENNELNLVVECVVDGEDKRKMALQVLVDYQQVPLIVDGKKCDTYYIEAEDNISIEKKIILDKDIDRSVDHKITALLINDLQFHAGDLERHIEINAAYFDAFLFCDKKKDSLVRPQKEYEIPISEYEEEFPQIFLTQDETGNKKAIPQNLIHAKPGETFRLYYHLGGFTNSEETVVFVDIGEKQTKINGKDYLLFHSDDPTKVLYGELELTAPMEEGKYEISAWAVNNPYGEIEMRMQGLYGGPRITLSVEK